MYKLYRLLYIIALYVAVGFSLKPMRSVRVMRTSSSLDATILETAATSKNFKTLLSVLESSGLTEALTGEGPFTVFAPTDEAFAKVPRELVETLMTDKQKLMDVLKFHVHPGRFSPTRNGKTLDTLLIGGDKFPKQLTLKVTSWDVQKFLITGQENIPQIVHEDVKCDNGLIHVINEVLLPYDGNMAPKVTFMGARDLQKEQTLQMGYYGKHAGEDRWGKKYEGPDVPFNPEEFPIGDAWKYGGNWKGGVENGGNNPGW